MENSIPISFHLATCNILQYRRQRDQLLEWNQTFSRFCSRVKVRSLGLISQSPQGKKRGFAGDPQAPEGAQRGTWAGARVAARGFPREKELFSSSVASTRGDPGAICSLTRSSFWFCRGGRPWVLRQEGVRALKAAPRRTRLCDALVTAGFTPAQQGRGRFGWEIAACPVLGRLHWDVLLGGCRAASCLQGHHLGRRCQDGAWWGRRWSCLPFLLPPSSSVQLDRLSATCKGFAGEKQASLAAVPNPISANINHSSHACHKIITRASGSLLKNKGFLNSRDRKEDKALLCSLKLSIYAWIKLLQFWSRVFAWKAGIYIPPQGLKRLCTLSCISFLQSHTPYLQLHYCRQLQRRAPINRFVAFFDKRWWHARRHVQAKSALHYPTQIKRCALRDSPVS